MGNKLSACSCAPLMRKAYRYEDSPWQTSKRRDGHLLRLWAEVFHVSASGAGSVKWQQVSEDLVPVNITCIQDAPNCIFLITAYNSQVDKILDVKLVQPGTRIGQASECFVYWKDPNTNDTWGLNFTSPIDARQFRECCSPSFKFSRKASSSYSLKLDPPSKSNKIKTKRKPLSTPASPNRSREPQCTCMTPEQYARLRAQQDPRFRGSSTLPRAQNRLTESTPMNMESLRAGSKVTAATSSTSLYDNVATCNAAPNKQNACTTTAPSQTRDRETATPGGKVGEYVMSSSVGTGTGSQTEEGQQQQQQGSKNEGVQTGISGKTTTGTCTPRMMSAKSRDDYSNTTGRLPRMSSKEHEMRQGSGVNLDPVTLKKMLKPVPSVESPVTSPEMTRRRYNYYNNHAHVPNDPQMRHKLNRFSGSRSSHEIGRIQAGRSMYLDLDRQPGDISPPSDNVLFDNQCYATTPSSSNGNSDLDQPSTLKSGRGGRCYHETASTPSSPTSRLLLEYEMHLRNTLAKGMDAESYSLHTFEALLTQSMENLEFAQQLPPVNSRSPYPIRRRAPNGTLGKSSTLPNNKNNSSFERPASSAAIRDREGYYSDRNELMRERGYMSDRERDKGYLSDQNAPRMRNDYNRCASCLGESARAQWFRHSDGWRSGSSTMGSATSGLSVSNYHSDHSRSKRSSAWDSLPSLRNENSLNDSGYKSVRTNSLEQRQDSLRSDYTSDRESRYGITQQTSIESTDSRLCYLTSSEVRHPLYNRETIEHITSGCSALANNEYTQRHDNICKQLHQALLKKYNIPSEDQPWYITKPQPVEENDEAKIYYNRSIITDRTRPNNRPDIVLTIKKLKKTYLIDVAIPNTSNIEKKHTEKIQKYIPLAEEIKQIWHQNTVKILPIIISATGVIPKTLHESLKILNLNKNMYIQMQKSVIINTCSIVRRFLNEPE
ncbi:hypothetical protein M8J77_009341 [Diaphorina citri]|nr:hypothetical protein M8J77_009341 [Diaphorina citri]